MVKGKKEMTNVKNVLHKNQALPFITYHQVKGTRSTCNALFT